MLPFFITNDTRLSYTESLSELHLRIIPLTQRTNPFPQYFHGIVRSVLKELVSVYPHIHYALALERIPQKRDELDTRDYSDTMLPEDIRTVHPRIAIS